MTEAHEARARRPWLTIALQVIGVISVYVGIRMIVDAAGCDAGDCLWIGGGILNALWGLICIATGIRGRVGFILLIVAIVFPLAFVLAIPGLVVLFLAVVFVTTAMSKAQLAPYYRWERSPR